MADHLDLIGQSVGDYRLVQWLGGGGFGNVYLAETMRDGQKVAVKVLQARLSRQDDLYTFINEARAIRLRHPHITPLLDFGISREEKPFLVMEYAPQGTLRDRHPRGTRVPLLTSVEYATQVASALQYAHNSHVIHRDVKPENMLVRADGAILLSDFGIATTAHSTHSLPDHRAIGGTLPYISPEQLAGQPRTASDQYALAVVVYEWIAGRTPFRGTAIEVAMQHATQPPPSLREQVSGVSNEVETVLFKALAKDYQERFPSLQAFATALQHASFPSTSHQLTFSSVTRLRGAASSSVIPPAEASSSVILPPAFSLPATENASLALPSYTSLSVTQMARSIPKTPLISEMKSPVTDVSSQKRFTTAPPHAHVLPPARTRSFAKRWSVLLVLLIVFLLVGSSYVAWTKLGMQNTIKPGIHPLAAATIRVTATVAMKATSDAYIMNVTQHGVMFGFDATHTHNNPYEHILNSANISHLHQVWAASTGELIYSSPAVANDMVYVGSNDQKLYAFDAITGQTKWTALIGGQVDSAPAVANGMVYVGSADGNLHAFDAITGQPKWATPGAGDSSPLVDNGVVYIGSYYDHKLHALDATTGQPKWDALTGGRVNSSPAIANNLIYVGSDDHKLYAFDAATGLPKWTASTSAPIFSSPAIAHGVVYVGSEDHKLYAFDAATGQQKWAILTGGTIFSSPAVANGIVYIGSYDHMFYAFNAATGQQKWAVLTGGGVGSSPTVANGIVYVGTEDYQLYAFSASTGQRKWAASTGDFIFSSPAVASGMIYVGSKDHKLYAFSLSKNGA